MKTATWMIAAIWVAGVAGCSSSNSDLFDGGDLDGLVGSSDMANGLQPPGNFLGHPLCLTGDSKVIDRASARIAERDGLQHPSTPSGSGTVSSSSNSRGTLDHWSWSSSTVTLTETFTYDSSGQLTNWRQSWSDSTPTVDETFTYDSSGTLTNATRTGGGSGTPTVHCS